MHRVFVREFCRLGASGFFRSVDLTGRLSEIPDCKKCITRTRHTTFPSYMVRREFYFYFFSVVKRTPRAVMRFRDYHKNNILLCRVDYEQFTMRIIDYVIAIQYRYRDVKRLKNVTRTHVIISQIARLLNHYYCFSIKIPRL